MIFTKKWPLSNIFTSTSSLCFWVLIVCLFIWVFFHFLCVCVCLVYSRTNEQFFIKNIVGRTDWRKKLLKERSGSYFGYIKIMNCQRSHFNVFLMTLAFYLTFLWRLPVIYNIWFYFIVFLTILYITWETGYMGSSVLLSLSASCYCLWCICWHLLWVTSFSSGPLRFCQQKHSSSLVVALLYPPEASGGYFGLASATPPPPRVETFSALTL